MDPRKVKRVDSPDLAKGRALMTTKIARKTKRSQRKHPTPINR